MLGRSLAASFLQEVLQAGLLTSSDLENGEAAAALGIIKILKKIFKKDECGDSSRPRTPRRRFDWDCLSRSYLCTLYTQGRQEEAAGT